jgi:adenosylmethionine-8-amino-7-oxononanoate aminotransferase
MNPWDSSQRGEYALWHGAISERGRRKLCAPGKALVEGKGIRVRDQQGRWYIDARSSLRTVTLGYGNQRIVSAIQDQAAKLPFAEIVRHDRPSEVALTYAEALVNALPSAFTRVRFTTSGSRMVEEAVLLSRFVRVMGEAKPSRTVVIANTNAWHGTGALANALTGYPELNAMTGQLASHVHHVAPNDVAALDATLEKLGPGFVTAILIEPVLGVEGVFLTEEYLRGVQDRCRRHGIHLLVDEVTTGVGRLGHMAYSAALGIQPDILMLGKGLTSGYAPIAALAVTEEIYQGAISAFPDVLPSSSTNDGHPLSMAAGLAVLDILSDGSVFENVRLRGAQLGELLAELEAESTCVRATVGQGLMHFVELCDGEDPWDLESMRLLSVECEERGMLIDRVGNRVIITPPLVSTSEECKEMADILFDAIGEACQTRQLSRIS